MAASGLLQLSGVQSVELLSTCSSNQHTCAAHFLDFLLGGVAEVLGFDNDGLVGQLAFAEHFEETLQMKIG